MARKSRRNKSTEVNISQDIVKNKNLLDTAAYVRLSVENGGNETDETLVVQQMLVEKYIEEHPDLRLAGTYSDNGFSGTNFERPGFIKLMENRIYLSVSVIVQVWQFSGRKFPMQYSRTMVFT